MSLPERGLLALPVEDEDRGLAVSDEAAWTFILFEK
jgi:hypothetical protein